jgi:glycolate oxidase iron-sulfur subunit
LTRKISSIQDVSWAESEKSDKTGQEIVASAPNDVAEVALPERSGPATVPRVPTRNVVDYELLFDCVHCGLCLESCPTYVITRAETDSPRGRIYLMKALAEGRLDLDRDAVRHLDLCLECRGCETACPSGVRYGRLIEDARSYVEQNWRRGIIERLRNSIIGAIFPHPRRLRAALAAFRFAEQIGIVKLLRGFAPSAARDWIELLPALNEEAPPLYPGQPESAFTLFQERPPEAPSVVVHHGCVAQVLTQSANVNCERELAAAGYRVQHLHRTVCCGALDVHHGNLERAREFARANVAALAASGAERIVSAASGCSAVIAQYAELLKNDQKLAATARQVSARVTDLSSLLLDRLKPVAIIPNRGELRTTVTYHDSCHLVHGMGVCEPPRELLRSLPGVHLVELAESDLCCGSAGTYNLTQRKMAAELARRKVENIVATGADYVVLSNPGCQFQIAAELRRRGSSIRVMHLADFIALMASTFASASA